MLIGYEMFLLAAEELNFSRAAERGPLLLHNA